PLELEYRASLAVPAASPLPRTSKHEKTALCQPFPAPGECRARSCNRAIGEPCLRSAIVRGPPLCRCTRWAQGIPDVDIAAHSVNSALAVPAAKLGPDGRRRVDYRAVVALAAPLFL